MLCLDALKSMEPASAGFFIRAAPNRDPRPHTIAQQVSCLYEVATLILFP